MTDTNRDERESLDMCCLSTVRLVQLLRSDVTCSCGEAYFFDRDSALPRPPRTSVPPGERRTLLPGERRSSVPGERRSSPDPMVHRATMPGPLPQPVSIEDAGAAIANLLAWLPDLSPRSGPLVRDGIRVSTSATALDGRLDRIDEQSRRVNAAVRAWVRLRGMILSGDGRHAAVLWAAFAGVVELHDAEGRRLGGPTQRARVVEAVALGCASRVLREEWRAAAKERPSVITYTSLLYPAYASPVPEADGEAPRDDGRPKARARTFQHVGLRGAQGPAVEAQAVAWGAERLADLWAPAPVPTAEARAFALGFAGAGERARWESLKVPAVRDAEAAARGEAILRAAEEAWGARR